MAIWPHFFGPPCRVPADERDQAPSCWGRNGGKVAAERDRCDAGVFTASAAARILRRSRVICARESAPPYITISITEIPFWRLF